MASTLKITQVRSAIRQSGRQKRTLEALGLRRMHQTVLHNDTPQIRGMVKRVAHLVRLEIDTDGAKRLAKKRQVSVAKSTAVAEAPAEPAGDKTAGAAPARKSAARKPATKKTPARKSAAKKTTAKKSAAKKSAAKKTATKKTATKKTAAKKTATKKTAAKKTPGKKAAAKKSASAKSDKTGE